MPPKTVMAFTGNPGNPYISVRNITFAPAPPLLPGMYQVPSRAQPFPNREFNKNASIPLMDVTTIYNYERSGKVAL